MVPKGIFITNENSSVKILNVNITLDPISGGGTAERTFQISRALTRAEIKCTVLTTDVGFTQERSEALSNAEVIALPCLSKRFFIPKVSYKFIKSIIAESDVIHLMNHWTFLNALVYLISYHLNKPYVVCPAGALPIYGRSKFIKKLYNWVIGKKIIRNANGHIAIAVNEIDQFQEYGVKLNNISIIPNGINREDFKSDNVENFRVKYEINNHPFIMFMGRLNSIKGPDLLLRAFSNLSEQFANTHLVFAGPDGGMLIELEAMAVKADLEDRVHFIGYIGGEEKSQAYHAAELVVIPSRQEAMSIVVLEAGISDTPVLITDQCGFDEVERMGGGKVVPATVDGLIDGLVDLLGDPGSLKSKGERLKDYTSENYTWDAIIQKYIHMYHQLLNSKN
jgi:glycosyltransferase involved in cell wall biosynthesis